MATPTTAASSRVIRTHTDEWLAAKGDVRPSTLRGYAQHINKHLRPALGHLRHADVRIAHVAERLADVTRSAANRHRSAVSLLLAAIGSVIFLAGCGAGSALAPSGATTTAPAVADPAAVAGADAPTLDGRAPGRE